MSGIEGYPEYEQLNWTVVHGRGVLHTGHANSFVRTLAMAGLVAGRDSYYYMRYDDSPERDNIPMIFYTVMGNPNIEVVLHEEVEPVGQVFNALVVLDSSILIHPTSQRAMLFDGAKRNAVLAVNTSLSQSQVLGLVKKHSLRQDWTGKLVTVRARKYDIEIAYPLLGALAKASGVVGTDDLYAALHSLGKSEKFAVVEKAFNECEPVDVRVDAEETDAESTTTETKTVPASAPKGGSGWSLELYRQYQKAAATAPSYAERIESMPRWEALAPGLIEFGPLPGERNIGFRTSFSRYLQPVINMEKCTDCKLCHIYCPDGAIDFQTIRVDMNYCQGCGICAQVCPVKAIQMIGEMEAREGLKEEETVTIGEALREYGY